MPEPFVRAIRADEIAPGGMKAIELSGRTIVVCNSGGTFHAIARRCGHMNAPLDLGTLDGSIVTCPMHCAQFDVTTGEALCGPLAPYAGGEVPPPRIAALLRNAEMLMQRIGTEPIATYHTRLEAGWVWIDPSA